MLSDVADRRVFSFPSSVNETSARLVASGVLVQGLAFLIIRQWWVLVPLTYGFLARVLTGPTLSPLAQFVTRVVTPRIAPLTESGHEMVPGPPKRFAQLVGLTFSGGALLAVAFGGDTLALVLIVGLVMAASLEAFVGLCLGCIVFAKLMRWGIIPASVCEECSDIRPRLDLLLQRR
jgi:hypothetical protein